jgi:AcrR family transcriptional regulator
VSDTRQRLLDGAVQTLRDKGIAGTSARSIAATAGVNQGLIFYHFGSVDELIVAACQAATTVRIGLYRDRFAEVGSLRELLVAGRELHEAERAAGNVAMLAQVLAGAQQNKGLAEAAKLALNLWIAEIETVLDRLMRDSPISVAVDRPGLAQGVAAAFIGIELYDGVDPSGAQAALGALEQLSVLTELLDELGPVARRALRNRVRRVKAANARTA